MARAVLRAQAPGYVVLDLAEEALQVVVVVLLLLLVCFSLSSTTSIGLARLGDDTW